MPRLSYFLASYGFNVLHEIPALSEIATLLEIRNLSKKNISAISIRRQSYPGPRDDFTSTFQDRFELMRPFCHCQSLGVFILTIPGYLLCSSPLTIHSRNI